MNTCNDNHNYVVYKHTSPSGKVYIGITSDTKRRWAANGYYYYRQSAFANAIHKYGWDNIKHEVLYTGLTKQDAANMEVELIAHYKALGISYNITDGGLGYRGKHSVEHVTKTVETRRRNSKFQVVVIDKQFDYFVFHTIVDAAKFLGVTSSVVSHVLLQPVGYTCKGHYVIKVGVNNNIDIKSIKTTIVCALNERKAKMAKNAPKPRIKAVLQYDTNGCIINEFASISEAARSLYKNTTSGIIRAIKNKCIAYGYMWKYKN